ncbi:MAG: hypothetical protein QM217_05435 [Bacillota bacterium]|nr:hypothetical protein [Bacillota bacterium]
MQNVVGKAGTGNEEEKDSDKYYGNPAYASGNVFFTGIIYA